MLKGSYGILIFCFTVTSQWARWRLKSPAYRLLKRLFYGANQRKYQSSTSLAFLKESTGDRWYTSQKATHAENGSIWWRHHGYWYYVLLVVITFNSESHTYRDLSNPLPSLHPGIPKTPLIYFQLKSYEWTSVKYVSLHSSKHHCTLNQGSNYRLVITHWAWASLLDHSNPFQTLNILKGALFAIFLLKWTHFNSLDATRVLRCGTVFEKYRCWNIPKCVK